MDQYPPLSPAAHPADERMDQSLRPDGLASYVGQEPLKALLAVSLEAAKRRGSPLDHVLLYGPPGLGKTSLAHVIAREMGAALRMTSGPSLAKPGDAAAILTSLQPGDVLFIDEIHRIPRTVEEVLYPAMEDGCLDIMLGKGPSASSVRIDLPPFTLIGATTKAGSLTQPLRERFGISYRLEFYEQDELERILARSAAILKLEAEAGALAHIAGRARRTPRVANRLLRRVRDFAEVHSDAGATEELTRMALLQLDIDEHGLDRSDRAVISLIAGQFSGGPVGLATLAAASGEERETLEEVVEPYLLRLGFLDRTPRGRVLTDHARKELSGWLDA